MNGMRRFVIVFVVVGVLAAGVGVWLARPHDTVAGCETAVTKQIDAALAAGKDTPESKGLPECDGLTDKDAQGVADRVVEKKLGDVFGG